VTAVEASKEIESWKDVDDNNLEYFKDTVIALLKR